MADEFQYKISIDDNEALAAFGRIAKKAEQTAKEAKAALGKIELGEQAKEVEKAFALIQKSGSYSIKQLTKEELELQKALELLGATGQFSFDKTTKSAKLSAAAIGIVAGITQQLVGEIINLAKRAPQAVIDLGKAAIAANSQFETFTVQFQTLLGSAEAAQQRIGELEQFGLRTPFELPEIVEASRTLEVFGGATLSTGESLRRVGDAAAATNNNFQDVAFWVGRMYDAIQSGRPFGEAALRLQEMGILTGGARQQMEDLQKAGAGADEVFGVFTNTVDTNFAGAMDRLSDTLQGVISNLNDFANKLLRVGGEALFTEVKDSAQEFLDILSDPAVQEALSGIAQSVGQLAAVSVEFVASGILDQLESIDPKAVERLGASMEDFAKAMSQFLQADISADLNGLINTLTILTDTLTTLVNEANSVGATFGTVQAIIKPIKDVFIGILFPVYKLIEGFGALSDLVETITGINALEAGADVSRIIAENSITASQRFEEAAAFANQAFSAPTNLNTRRTGGGPTAPIVPDETAEELEKALEKLSELERDYARDRIDILRKAGQKRVDAEQEFIEKRIDQARKFLNDIEDIERKNNQAITDSGTDLRRDEEDAYIDYNRKLIDIDKESAKSRIKVEEDYRDEVKKIQTNFEFDSEEAIRNRDAVTFLRLQRQRDRQIQEARTSRDEKIKSNTVENEDKRAQLQQELQYELEDARLADERRLEDLKIRLERELEEARLKNSRELDELALAEDRKRQELKTSLDRQVEEAKIANDRRVSDYKESLDEEIAALIETEEKKKEILKNAVNDRLELDNRLQDLKTLQRQNGLTPLIGGRAYGGPVGAGQSVIVGDRTDNRPEIFTPSMAGYISPTITNPLLNSMMGNNYTTNATVNQSMLDPGQQSAMMRAIARNEAVSIVQRLLNG